MALLRRDPDYRFTQDQVVHLAADGTELRREWGFDGPEALAVDPRDGSVWVTHCAVSPTSSHGKIYISHVDAAGRLVYRITYPGGLHCSRGTPLLVDPGGSAWLWSEDGIVLRVASDGHVMWRAPAGWSRSTRAGCR